MYFNVEIIISIFIEFFDSILYMCAVCVSLKMPFSIASIDYLMTPLCFLHTNGKIQFKTKQNYEHRRKYEILRIRCMWKVCFVSKNENHSTTFYLKRNKILYVHIHILYIIWMMPYSFKVHKLFWYVKRFTNGSSDS